MTEKFQATIYALIEDPKDPDNVTYTKDKNGDLMHYVVEAPTFHELMEKLRAFDPKEWQFDWVSLEVTIERE